MQRILSTELAAHPYEKIVVEGWVHRIRRLKSVSFLIVRDAAALFGLHLSARNALSAIPAGARHD